MTDPAGTYRELAERYGLDIETIGGGAQMLSRYFASGTGVHVTCLDGGGLPASDNWHIGVHPANWDGDGGSLLFERRSDDGGARSFPDTIDAALWTAEYGRRSIGALTEEYAAFLKEEGLPELSADELLHEDLKPNQRRYVSAFLVRWSDAESVAQDTIAAATYNIATGGRITMSRRDIPIKDGERRAVRAVVGYDRPLETFFAQVFETDADGEEDAFLWQGTFPGELPTPRSAIALIEPFCDVPADLAAALETDRLKTLAQQDSPGQAEAKRLLIRGEPAQPRPSEPKD